MRPVSLDLSLIGDCGRVALIDRDGSVAWCCMPRVDGQPLLDRLLSGRGRWSFGALELSGRSQRYLGRAPVVVTTHRSPLGSYESVDFFPWRGPGRAGRCLVRLLRPLEGLPRVRMSFRPAARWGEDLPGMSRTPTGLVFDADWSLYQLHASPDARLYTLLAGGALPLERPVAFVLGQLDAPEDLSAWAHEALKDTAAAWERWLDGLALPRRWGEACARSAVVLKLCTDEDTGGIVAAPTTSIPEAPESGRCWDYRYCWLRDGFFAARELSRLGAHGAVAGWRRWLSAVLARDGAALRPLYDLDGAPPPAERVAEGLPGYRGMGPVRVGNQAAEQVQHDVWGDALAALSLAGAGALDPALTATLEALGEAAWARWDQPDAGIWELRGSAHVHTASSLFCQIACDRLAGLLGDSPRAGLWRERAERLREAIPERAWSASLGAFSGQLGGETLDASALLLPLLGLVSWDDPRTCSTVATLEAGLRRGDDLMRYAAADDFGEPETAFNLCTFWLIEALARSGRSAEAERLFEGILSARSAGGLLSEDRAPETGELWGNLPQVYAHVGILACAWALG